MGKTANHTYHNLIPIMQIWIVLAVFTILIAFPGVARADMAPPAHPPGSNPEPGSSSTQVRMLAEKVLIDVRPGSGDSLGKALVTADFTMRNQGNEKETMAARFPISTNDGYSGLPEIQDLQVKINGKRVPTRRILGEDPYYRQDQVPWAEFDVTFPPGKNVDVRITYTLEGSGWPPYVNFNYILSTGAGWKDSIGKADLVVRLPYEANDYHVLLNQDGWSQTTPGGVMEGNTISWHYENLEPTTEDNLALELVMPAVWQKVLQEQANVEKNPRDGEAWGRLGKLYKELAFLPKILRPDPGGKKLYQLSIDAYQNSLRLKPNDADWHVGLADLYWKHFEMTHWGYAGASNDYSDLEKASRLLKRAIEINPKSPRVLEMLELFEAYDYVSRQGEEYDFLLLTATPAPRATNTTPPTLQSSASLTPTILPTHLVSSEAPVQTPAGDTTPAAAASTSEVVARPTTTAVQTPASKTPAEETPEPEAGLQVCGVTIAALPIAAMIVVGRKKRG